MSSLVLAALAGLGTAALWWPPSERTRRSGPATWSRRIRSALDRVGLPGVGVVGFARTTAAAAIGAALLTTLALGWSPLSLLAAGAAAILPGAYWRNRHRAALATARTHWPRLVEELRIQVGPMGRSIPQALLDVGERAPEALRPAFRAAQREWNLRTDIEGMLHVLAEHLADPTADATCETLLVIHQVGGDPDPRLADLAAARRQDLLHRRESDARQAGARLARWFVIAVPVGMGIAGANVGDGLAAYRTPTAQVLVGAAVALVVVCWTWAGHLMRLPAEPRVFAP